MAVAVQPPPGLDMQAWSPERLQIIRFMAIIISTKGQPEFKVPPAQQVMSTKLLPGNVQVRLPLGCLYVGYKCHHWYRNAALIERFRHFMALLGFKGPCPIKSVAKAGIIVSQAENRCYSICTFPATIIMDLYLIYIPWHFRVRLMTSAGI